MIDGSHTTIDWQTHPSDVLILPVGAFEQHSVHLPLATDTLQADYFAARVAEALDAALLPALAITTSMEHTGYRGSFSLRPETLMQIVRDIADEAERQHFRILIVLNAHGGNHALVPVCRDINRRDRPLKILLANYWEHGQKKVVGASTRPGLDIHANAQETSIILALHPDLVRTERADAAYDATALKLQQADLTTFGIGHMTPSGAAGWPSEASAEQGRALIENLAEGLIAHLRERVARLRTQPRYAGPGGLALRPLGPADIAAGMRLVACAGWNQRGDDWRMLLQASPHGCFAMVHQGAVVGTVTTTPYGSLAWIGMVLVDPPFRGQGIAARLMERALAALDGVPTVALDATPAGRGVYAKLGFADAGGLTRFTHAAAPALAGDVAGVRPMQATDVAALATLDRDAFGGDRRTILQALVAAAPERAFVHVEGARISGYVLGRAGTHFEQVGPLVAEHADVAHKLLRAALQSLRGRPVLLDVPDHQAALHDTLAQAGFRPQRPFIRMIRGTPKLQGDAQRVFASGGPEIG